MTVSTTEADLPISSSAKISPSASDAVSSNAMTPRERTRDTERGSGCGP